MSTTHGAIFTLALADITCMGGEKVKDLHLDLKILEMLSCLN